MNAQLYYCRLCGRDSFARRAVHKSSPGALNSTCPGDFKEQRVESCFSCEWMKKKACPDTRIIVHTPWLGCGSWTRKQNSDKPVMTKTKHRGQAEAAGPFVICRRRKAGQQLAGRVLYKQRRGGWSQDPEAAWKFDTEQSAKFVLRGNEGEVVSVEDLDGDRPDGLARVPQAGRTAGQAECEPGVFDVAPTATAGAVVLSGKLNALERELKTRLEGQIDEGRQAFMAVGEATNHDHP